MVLIKVILLHCNSSKEITEIQQDIIVISWFGVGPNKLKLCVAVRLPGPEVQGSAIVTKTWGIGLLSIMLQPIKYHLSIMPEPYELALTPKDISIEEIKAWAAMEENYMEAM